MNINFSLEDVINEDTNVFPLFSEEDEKLFENEVIPSILPILPLRNTILFPGIIIPITVGREKSMTVVKQCYKSKKPIGVLTQKDDSIENPDTNDLYKIGTLARILRTLNMPDGSITILVQGIKRFIVEDYIETEPYYKAQVSEYQTNDYNPEIRKSKNFKALIVSLKEISSTIIKSSNSPQEANFALKNIESSIFLLNFLDSTLNISISEKQAHLELVDVEERAKLVLAALNKEFQIIKLKNQIQNKVKNELDKQQREYILNQQLKTIQTELGGTPSDKALQDLKKKAKLKKWNKETKDLFEKEFEKLERTNNMSPDFSVQLNYLELFVDLPWNTYTKDNFDLNHARKILEKDHFGLEKVKERILEYIAVLKLKNDMKSPILCLLGPPGVGKTSLGKSVATAMNRKYIRMSLGGLHDESELRGHRKTYIGAMPGRIIQNIRKVKSANPIFILDEIDKVSGMNMQGDPSAALLEILDPEQNNSFYDNYLETTFDLSKVLFFATANSISTVHPALRDRMEIIDITGYLLEEKIQIAKKHLIPKLLEEHGIKAQHLNINNKTIEVLIEEYTRESGVRALEKALAKIIRHRAAQVSMNEDFNKILSIKEMREIMGIPIFQKDKISNNDIAGVVTGLAWTPVGGEILFIESVLSKGKGELTMTGSLGDVMKESATIAFEFLKSHADELKIDYQIFENCHIHIHVPEGATPKDGPSAGITMLTSLYSLLTQQKVRKDIAMTGEITLRGEILPVGGIKEKILAAKRSKINEIVMCEDNRKDIEDIQATYIEGMTFRYYKNMIEALHYTVLDKQVHNAKNLSALWISNSTTTKNQLN